MQVGQFQETTPPDVPWREMRPAPWHFRHLYSTKPATLHDAGGSAAHHANTYVPGTTVATTFRAFHVDSHPITLACALP